MAKPSPANNSRSDGKKVRGDFLLLSLARIQAHVAKNLVFSCRFRVMPVVSLPFWLIRVLDVASAEYTHSRNLSFIKQAEVSHLIG